jgi:hypothetical protein
MRKYVFLLVVLFVFMTGFVGGQKAAFNKMIADVEPTKGFESAYAKWIEKYGKSIDSIQTYKIAELNTILGFHAKAINSKVDVNGVKEMLANDYQWLNVQTEILTDANNN